MCSQIPVINISFVLHHKTFRLIILYPVDFTFSNPDKKIAVKRRLLIISHNRWRYTMILRELCYIPSWCSITSLLILSTNLVISFLDRDPIRVGMLVTDSLKNRAKLSLSRLCNLKLVDRAEIRHGVKPHIWSLFIVGLNIWPRVESWTFGIRIWKSWI